MLMWGAWLVIEVVFFSIGRKFHRYYLVMLAPPIAALVGIGLVALWQRYGERGWRSWLLPLSLLTTATSQIAVLVLFPDWGRVLAPLVGGTSVLTASALLVLRWREAWLWAKSAYAIGVIALLIAPAAWAITPLWGAHPTQPYAGPELWSAPMDVPQVERLVAYLHAHQGNERFLAATVRANIAAPLMLLSGGAVLTLGGYSGGDAILTPEQFAARVAANDLRFVLLPDKTNQQPELASWVGLHCAIVPSAVWQASPTNSKQTSASSEEEYTLFDCE